MHVCSLTLTWMLECAYICSYNNQPCSQCEWRALFVAIIFQTRYTMNRTWTTTTANSDHSTGIQDTPKSELVKWIVPGVLVSCVLMVVVLTTVAVYIGMRRRRKEKKSFPLSRIGSVAMDDDMYCQVTSIKQLNSGSRRQLPKTFPKAKMPHRKIANSNRPKTVSFKIDEFYDLDITMFQKKEMAKNNFLKTAVNSDDSIPIDYGDIAFDPSLETVYNSNKAHTDHDTSQGKQEAINAHSEFNKRIKRHSSISEGLSTSDKDVKYSTTKNQLETMAELKVESRITTESLETRDAVVQCDNELYPDDHSTNDGGKKSTGSLINSSPEVHPYHKDDHVKPNSKSQESKIQCSSSSTNEFSFLNSMKSSRKYQENSEPEVNNRKATVTNGKVITRNESVYDVPWDFTSVGMILNKANHEHGTINLAFDE